MIIIREPIWKDHSIGIAENAITEDTVEVKISYKRKDGTQPYPETYTMPASIIRRHDVMYRKGVKLYIVPISALKIKGIPPPTTYGE